MKTAQVSWSHTWACRSIRTKFSHNFQIRWELIRLKTVLTRPTLSGISSCSILTRTRYLRLCAMPRWRIYRTKCQISLEEMKNMMVLSMTMTWSGLHQILTSFKIDQMRQQARQLKTSAILLLSMIQTMTRYGSTMFGGVMLVSLASMKRVNCTWAAVQEDLSRAKKDTQRFLNNSRSSTSKIISRSSN